MIQKNSKSESLPSWVKEFPLEFLKGKATTKPNSNTQKQLLDSLKKNNYILIDVIPPKERKLEDLAFITTKCSVKLYCPKHCKSLEDCKTISVHGYININKSGKLRCCINSNKGGIREERLKNFIKSQEEKHPHHKVLVEKTLLSEDGFINRKEGFIYMKCEKHPGDIYKVIADRYLNKKNKSGLNCCSSYHLIPRSTESSEIRDEKKSS